jgi:glucokinase
MPSADRLVLVADIGGTNTRVALARGRQVLGLTIRRFANAGHTGLAELLSAYIAAEGADPDAACVAVAGPVEGDRATLTNLDWTIDAATVARASRSEAVAVLNDLQAQGHALGHLPPGQIRALWPPAGPPVRGGTQLVVNLGTGFNIAVVYDTPAGRLVPPAEAGHVCLPVRSERDLRLARSVGATHGFASVEEVLSGRGIVQLYDWLGEEEGDATPATSAEIIAALARGGDSRAIRAGREFVRILGTVAGDLALTTLPMGGIWLVGGLARAFAPYLLPFGFAAAFRDKGRFSGFMERFGVGVVEDDNAALTGCAAHAAELLDHRAGA